MRLPEVVKLSNDNCNLGYNYSKQNHEIGGVGIIRNYLKDNSIDFSLYCRQLDFECCTVQITRNSL